MDKMNITFYQLAHDWLVKTIRFIYVMYVT